MLEQTETIGFRNKERATANLTELATLVPSAAMNRVYLLLGGAADPDGALHYLVRLSTEQLAAFQRLSLSPAGLQHLVTVFSFSRFLSEIILKLPHWIELLPSGGDLHRVVSPEEMRVRLEAQLTPDVLGLPEPLSLALFRRRQILRILIRDLMGLATLADVTEELSNLADAILEATYRRIRTELSDRYGTPRYADETGDMQECGFSIIALGKLGGRELNYSSDSAPSVWPAAV